MTDRIQLTDGSPVPSDRSHTEINPKKGMQKGYVVLSPEERAKGFVKPVRRSYVHAKCGTLTTQPRVFMLTGQLYDEATMARVALAFEQATEFKDKHPVLA